MKRCCHSSVFARSGSENIRRFCSSEEKRQKCCCSSTNIQLIASLVKQLEEALEHVIVTSAESATDLTSEAQKLAQIKELLDKLKVVSQLIFILKEHIHLSVMSDQRLRLLIFDLLITIRCFLLFHLM